MKDSTFMLTDDYYLFKEEFEKVLQNARKLNMDITEAVLKDDSMIYQIVIDNNMVISMQRDISYNYTNKGFQDAIEISTKDERQSLSFIINRNVYKNNIYVFLNRNYEAERILEIEPRLWFSFSKLVGISSVDKKKTYLNSKTMINTNMKIKYMNLISSFIKYIKNKYKFENINDGFKVIYQQLDNIVGEMTASYELKNNKSRKRVK